MLAFTLGYVAFNPGRMHLVDMYPRENPTNFLLRGDNPVVNGALNLTALVAALTTITAAECGVTLPSGARFVDLDLENPSDPGYFAELQFWKANPSLGYAESWTTLGSLLVPKVTPHPDEVVANGSWAIAGHADHLPERLAATRALLTNTSGGPTVRRKRNPSSS